MAKSSVHSVHSVHPAAEAFPMMGEVELNALAVDIAANGQRQPAVLTPDGQLLDGRNRVEACRRIKAEPTFITFEGDPWTYSRSVNLWRRNMTTGQRAASCALSLVAEGKRKDGRWSRGSVPLETDNQESLNSGAWREAMKQAGFIHDWIPDALLGVRDGTMALDAAYKKAKAAEDKYLFEQEQERKKREAEMAASDAELATFLSGWHNELNLDLSLAAQATDADNWRGVLNLVDKLEVRRQQLKEYARVKLES